jgi:hypothetical protein
VKVIELGVGTEVGIEIVANSRVEFVKRVVVVAAGDGIGAAFEVMIEFVVASGVGVLEFGILAAIGVVGVVIEAFDVAMGAFEIVVEREGSLLCSCYLEH